MMEQSGRRVSTTYLHLQFQCLYGIQLLLDLLILIILLLPDKLIFNAQLILLLLDQLILSTQLILLLLDLNIE